ncbi:hypothetical protein NPIL_33261, partial [Nephila pilipes]
MPKPLEYTSESDTASSEDVDINLPGPSQVTQVQWKKVVTKDIPAFLEEAAVLDGAMNPSLSVLFSTLGVLQGVSWISLGLVLSLLKLDSAGLLR